MSLRSLPVSDREFYQDAKRTKQAVLQVVEHSAHHPGIQRIQDIFRRNAERMYRWADDRNGADGATENNLAERTLRPTVIARKVSFGSQSENGAKTREILMSVLLTLKQRFSDFQTRFKTALDSLAQNPSLHPYDLLFQQDPSHPARN